MVIKNIILKILIYVVLLIAVLFTAWIDYSKNRKVEEKVIKKETFILNNGQNVGRGNLLGMQVFMTGRDYSTEYTFYDQLESLLQQAKYNGFLNHQTTVLFPEHIGTFLVLVDENPKITNSKDFQEALSFIKSKQDYKFKFGFLDKGSIAKDIESVLKYKAEKMKNVYFKVFSKLATIYGIHIVAGTIVLPSPIVKNGKIFLREGKLQNVSFVFKPDGSVMESQFIKKTTSEIESSVVSVDSNKTIPMVKSNNLPYVSTILTSHDTLGNASYVLNTEKRPDAILSPSCLLKKEDLKWYFKKYAKKFNPDIQETIKTNAMATDLWLTYTLPQWIFFSGAQIGLQIFLKGEILGIEFSGVSYYINGTEIQIVPMDEKTAIVNVWY